MKLKHLILLIFIPAAFALTFWGHGGQDKLLLGCGMILITLALLFQKEHLEITPSPASHMLIPLVVLAALPWLSLLWTAQFRTSLESALLASNLIILILITAMLPERKREILLIILIYLTAGSAIYGILQTRGVADNSFWHNSHMASRMVNSAPYASMLAAALITGAGIAADKHHPLKITVILLPLPIIFYALIQTNCRAVWAICILAVTLLFIKWHSIHKKKKSEHRSRKVILIICALAVIAVISQIQQILPRITSLRETGWQSMGQRSAVWSDSINMIKHKPLGTGAGCFSEEYLIYKVGNDRFHAFYAHNEVLHLTAELGWFTLIPLAALAFLFAISALLSFRGDTLTPAALHVAIGALLLHSLVDFPLHSMSNAILAAVIMGCLMPNHPVRKKRLPVNRVNSLIATTLLTVWIIMSIPMYWMNIAQKDSGAVSIKDKKRALQVATRFIPTIPEAHYELGAMEVAFSQLPGIPSGNIMQERAYSLFSKAASSAPLNAFYHSRLADISASLGKHSEAEKEYLRAISLDQGLGLYRKVYGDFLMSRGRMVEAGSQYIDAVSLFNDTNDTTPRSLILLILSAGADSKQIDDLCAIHPYIIPAWEKIKRERLIN